MLIVGQLSHVFAHSFWYDLQKLPFFKYSQDTSLSIMVSDGISSHTTGGGSVGGGGVVAVVAVVVVVIGISKHICQDLV